MSRLLKQIAYGIFFLAVFGAFGFGIYFLLLKPKPSCFDHVQNQGEEGIDCGQVCGNLCLPPDLAPVQLVDQVRIVTPDAQHIAFLANIQNTNAQFAVKSLPYTLRVVNKFGDSFDISGETFIYAQDSKYILEVRSPEKDFSAAQIARVELVMGNPQWVRAQDFTAPAIQLQDYKTEVVNGQVEISGRIVNQDTITLPVVNIVAVLHGGLNQIAGVSQTQVSNLLPGESRSFGILHPLVPNLNTAATQIFASGVRP